MFYSQFILAKKGPLGTIWIAAHLERKLRKNQVADTDIGVSVDSILFPEVPIALRLSSHLLLGVVRIYSRKVNYLFDDCSEALLKVKQAFRSTAVDLPPEESTAPYHSITLPETFDLDDFELPENENFQGNYVDHHVSAREQITLQDTMDGVVYSTSQFGLDERFGDGDTSQINLDLDEEIFQDKDAAAAGNEGFSGADHDASVDATTPPVKDAARTGAAEAMQVAGSENQVEDLAANIEYNEYAQAPQTPKLVEVPNISSAREEPACDDHMEVEDHNIAESNAAEESTKTSSELDPHEKGKSTEDWSSENNLNQASAVCMPPDEAGDGKTDAQNEMERTENARVESPCCSHITTDLEDPGQAKTIPKACTGDDVTDKAKEFASDTAPSMESPGRPSVVDAENPDCQEPKDPRAQTEMQGDGGHVTDVHQETDSSLYGDSRRSDEQPDNLFASDSQVENLTGSVDLPAPEKLLSVPDAEKENDFMVESTPKEDLGADKGDAGTKNITGKKRTFTESTLTAESLNSVESVGLICSRRTADSVPEDDDLLSSILVGRSSFLKMKPTPVLELASTKRLRSAPRSTVSKRKVPMDDQMVLHGDVIRQQLINAEDIRRIRKKAPCTRPEILMIHRQFLEDEVFREPIFTGMSVELVSLHSEPYDLNEIRIVESDEYHGAAKGSEYSGRPDVQEQPAETATDTQDQQSEGRDKQEQTKDTSGKDQVQLLQNELLGDKSEMKINKGDTVAADEVNYLNAHEEMCEIPTGEKNGIADDLLVEGSCENHDLKMDGQILEDASVVDINNKSSTDPIDVFEGDFENIVSVEMDMKAEDELLPDETKLDESVEINEFQTDPFVPDTSIETGGSCYPVLVNGNEAVGKTNKDGVQIAELESDDKIPTCNGVLNEEVKIISTCPPDPEAGIRSAILKDGENPNFEEVDLQSAMETGITSQVGLFSGNNSEIENVAVEHDTEFLNVDDDEVAENDDDDGMQYGDETRLLENSGWSSRTRAVAKYLQTLFDKEAEHGKKVLSVDNLLAGKTRKEASRMFFETLVLKTKDYIHVEQANPFDNTNIKPRAKLMKSVF